MLFRKADDISGEYNQDSNSANGTLSSQLMDAYLRSCGMYCWESSRICSPLCFDNVASLNLAGYFIITYFLASEINTWTTPATSSPLRGKLAVMVKNYTVK
jgi:hypothetical protein